MRRGLIFAITAACAGLTCAAARAETTPATAVDPLAKLSLLAAAFDGNDAAPAPERATGMAFLPGRGVVRWDITGLTPEQAREAQIEAMGAADARAVQREIDRAAEETARLDARDAERAALNRRARAGRLVLAMPSFRSLPRQTGAALANRGAGGRVGFSVRSGESLRGRPRMYAFAAVSGRSVGFNVMHDDAGWRNGGRHHRPRGFHRPAAGRARLAQGSGAGVAELRPAEGSHPGPRHPDRQGTTA